MYFASTVVLVFVLMHTLSRNDTLSAELSRWRAHARCVHADCRGCELIAQLAGGDRG